MRSANQEIVSRTREMNSNGRGTVTLYNGWLSGVLRLGLQKVPKQLQHCLGFPPEISLPWKIGNWNLCHSYGSFDQPVPAKIPSLSLQGLPPGCFCPTLK